MPDNAAIATMLKSQTRSALRMLRSAIAQCPDALWDDPADRNRTWQIAYHALFFGHFYGCTDQHAFTPWTQHQADVQYPDGIPGPPEEGSDKPLVAEPYTRAQCLDYCDTILARLDAAVEACDLDAETCGFPWYPIPKLEHQMVNLRHIQHHAANIAQRLRDRADIGIDWVGRDKGGG